jgi:hypothetical protein
VNHGTKVARTARTTALRANGRQAAGFGVIPAHGAHFSILSLAPPPARRLGPAPATWLTNIVPLKRSGADAPDNMQWQTVQDAKAKDRTE